MDQAKLFGGFTRTDITPDLGTLLMGYPNPDRKAESVRDPLVLLCRLTALVP